MYKHENKDTRLQQDCAAIIHVLEESISTIKNVCVMEDTDTAIALFARELATIIAHCAITLGANVHTGESF